MSSNSGHKHTKNVLHFNFEDGQNFELFSQKEGSTYDLLNTSEC